MLSAARIKELNNFLKSINIKMTDVELLDEALTHPSFNFEVHKDEYKDYERLEFLGDSVLRLFVSEFLYDKFPSYDEGKLTKIRSCLVSDRFLYGIAIDLDVAPYLNIGVHEEKTGGRNKESILACAMEAILGAIFKDCGVEQAKEFIYKLYSDVDINSVMCNFNSKELLQEYTQEQNKDLPKYNLIKETGLAHEKTYEVEVVYHNEVLGFGVGKTKKEAEKTAALDALKKLKLIEG